MKSLPLEVIQKHNVHFVILGADDMAYSLAHIIHRNYGVKPTLFASGHHYATSDSKILEKQVHEKLRNKNMFVSLLKDFKALHAEENLILFPIADVYTQLLIECADELKDDYLFVVPSKEVVSKLLKKEDFYEQCEKYGIDYPKTQTVSSDFDPNELTLRYPIVLKYSNSEMYMVDAIDELSKVYFIDNSIQLQEVLTKIQSSSYTDRLILQEFITGRPSLTYSVNGFADQNNKVRMMAMGQALAYDIDPIRIGNNWGLYTMCNQEVYNNFERFLNEIEFSGFANLDVKFDPIDQKYKALEINIRFPASMGFLDAGGVNFVDFYVRDLLNIPYDEEVYYHEGCDMAWLDAHPKAILKSCDAEIKEMAKNLLDKPVYYSQYYENDKSLKRWVRHQKRLRKTLKDLEQFPRLPE